MRRKFGRISPGEAQKMLASFSPGSRRDQMAEALELLTDQPVTASTASEDEADEEFDAGYAGLYPPRTHREKRDRRELAERIAASRPRGDDGELTDEEWLRTFGKPRRAEDEW
jgi:hypothetical protein